MNSGMFEVMNAARQSCEQFSSMGSDSMESQMQSNFLCMQVKDGVSMD